MSSTVETPHRGRSRRHPTRGSYRPSAQRSIPVRRLDRNLREADVPRWVVDRDPIFSHFLAVLSAVFPRGEDFFVATVREHRAAVSDDPILRAQVKAFIGQEAMHGREHRDLNRQLAAMGYPTEDAERRIDACLRAIMRLQPRTLPLAVTAGSEHLTGILAEAALGSEATRELLFGPEDIQALITWHALEELEHKNVAFDVLERAGGGYVVRIAGFGLAVGVLGGSVVVSTIAGAVGDHAHISWKERRRFVRNLGRQQLLSPWAVRQVLRYLRPGFHPDDMDTDHLVREWRERLRDGLTVTAGLREPS